MGVDLDIRRMHVSQWNSLPGPSDTYKMDDELTVESEELISIRTPGLTRLVLNEVGGQECFQCDYVLLTKAMIAAALEDRNDLEPDLRNIFNAISNCTSDSQFVYFWTWC